MASKDDTALWLHNKLGSSIQLWSSSNIVTQYNLDKLISIKDCFQNLDSLVKIKFFLSLFHIPRRNIEEFKSVVQEIIDETIEICNDQWVLSIALFVKSYWNKQTLITDSLPDIDSFKDSLNELRKNFKKCESLKMLPLECDYLTKCARATYADVPQVSKHFNLIRLAKSAALIQDLKLKATNFSKNKKPSLNEKVSSVPYFNRSLSKNISQIDKANSGITSSSASCFTSSNTSSTSQTPGFLKRSALYNSTITGKASLTKRDVGIKLLDLEDQPIVNKEAKRKKKEIEKEVIKKPKITDTKQKKNDRKDFQEETGYDSNDDESKEANKNCMDYELANKQPTEILDHQMNVECTDNLINQIINENEKPSYTIGLMNNNSEEVNKSLMFENEMQNVLNENININMDLNIQTKSTIYEYVNNEINNKSNDNNNKNIELNRNNIITVESNLLSSGFITQQSNMETDSEISHPFNSKKPQHSLTLTREQMLQAQEMFCNSNRLTRPEKALILGFMAGSRDNPRPEQGPIVTIKLNEDEEILASSTGQQHKVLSEIYFQMNYENGEYKKIKKIKPIVININ